MKLCVKSQLSPLFFLEYVAPILEQEASLLWRCVCVDRKEFTTVENCVDAEFGSSLLTKASRHV